MSDNNLFILCGFTGGIVVNYVVHELGHLIGAGITGLRVRGVVLFGFRFGSGLKGLQRFSHLKNAVVVNHGLRLRRLRLGIFALSGPAANFVLGLVAAGMVSPQSSALIKNALAGLAFAAITSGLGNLVPRVTRKGDVSDGRTIYELIRYGTVRSDNSPSDVPQSIWGYSNRRHGKAESPSNVASRQRTGGDDLSLIDTAPDALVKLVRDPMTPAATAVRAALILRYSTAVSSLAVDEAKLRIKLLQRADVVRLIAHGAQRHQDEPDDQQARASLGIFSLLEGSPSRAQELLPCLDLAHHPAAVQGLAFAVRALAEIELTGAAGPARSFVARAVRLNPSDVIVQLAERAMLHVDGGPRGLDASPSTSENHHDGR